MTQDLSQSSYLQTLQDPETSSFYGYRALDNKQFKVCATFATDSTQAAEGDRFRPSYDGYGYFTSDAFFNGKHPKGRHCYTFTVREKS